MPLWDVLQTLDALYWCSRLTAARLSNSEAHLHHFLSSQAHLAGHPTAAPSPLGFQLPSPKLPTLDLHKATPKHQGGPGDVV